LRTNRLLRFFLRSALLIPGLIPIRISAQTDSSLFKLDSTIVSASRRTSPLLLQSGTGKINISGMAKLPTIMGTADPIRFVKLLPSVQTSSEIDAGIHIQGCDHGHNITSIDNAPLHGVNHLLGLFSVFNPSHYNEMNYGTMAPMQGYLGGYLDLVPARNMTAGTHANLSLSPMAFQGTLRFCDGRKSALAISGRKTFLNEIYKPYMKIERIPFEYGFQDFNISWIMEATPQDKIYADIFHTSDAANVELNDNPMKMDFDWWSGLAALHWDHSTELYQIKQIIYASATEMNLDVTYNDNTGNSPAFTRDYGYRLSFLCGGVEAGAGISIYDVLPQYSKSSSGYMQFTQDHERQNASEVALNTSWTSKQLIYRWTLHAGLRGSWYLSPEKDSYWNLTPTLSVKYDMLSAGHIELEAGTASQNIFHTGITNLGFPVEFDILAGKYSAPQRSIFGSLSYSNNFQQGQYTFDVSLYFRKLQNQMEYSGNMLDFIRDRQDLNEMLLKGDGWNYGINLILQKQSGRLTGWLSGSVGRSIRRVPGKGTYTSDFERIFEIDATATYNAGKWDIGSNFIAASGTPFTAPENIYLIASQVICEYGRYNGSRLAPYIRLDLNFNWYFRKDSVTHGINISLYNALARNNEVCYKFKYKDGRFAYRPYSFAFKLLPGIGWFYKF